MDTFSAFLGLYLYTNNLNNFLMAFSKRGSHLRKYCNYNIIATYPVNTCNQCASLHVQFTFCVQEVNLKHNFKHENKTASYLYINIDLSTWKVCAINAKLLYGVWIYFQLVYVHAKYNNAIDQVRRFIAKVLKQTPDGDLGSRKKATIYLDWCMIFAFTQYNSRKRETHKSFS